MISNVADAGGLERARAAGIEAIVLSHRGWPSRDDYDRALARELQARDVGLVCLAGFMRLVGASAARRLSQRDPQHPSVAAAVVSRRRRAAAGDRARRQDQRRHRPFRDARARRRADHPAARRAGAATTTRRETLAARILVEEHRAYPEAVAVVLDGGWTVDGRRFVRL